MNNYQNICETTSGSAFSTFDTSYDGIWTYTEHSSPKDASEIGYELWLQNRAKSIDATLELSGMHGLKRSEQSKPKRKWEFRAQRGFRWHKIVHRYGVDG